MEKPEITRADIMAIGDFENIRAAKRKEIVALKRPRRIEVGPVAACYFESYDTMWWQIHEMLYIEKGGEAQIADELAAYNPLIPNGRELVATVMFEINDEERRRALLARLGGVEETVFVRFGDSEVRGVPEVDLDRTTASGKASSVQFIHFPFTDAQVRAFREPGCQAVIGFEHEAYGHMTVIARKSPARRSPLIFRIKKVRGLFDDFLGTQAPKVALPHPAGIGADRHLAPLAIAAFDLRDDPRRHLSDGRRGIACTAPQGLGLLDDDDTALGRQHRPVHPALGAFGVADFPPAFEFRRDRNGQLLADEDPFDGVAHAWAGPDIDLVGAQGGESDRGVLRLFRSLRDRVAG